MMYLIIKQKIELVRISSTIVVLSVINHPQYFTPSSLLQVMYSYCKLCIATAG